MFTQQPPFTVALGSRSARLGVVAGAVVLLSVAVAFGGCNLNAPTEPNPGLTGSGSNEDFTFNGTIALTASSSTVPADDASLITISAEIRDDNGNPAQNLTPVNFVTDTGAFIDPLSGDLVTGVNVASFNGQASVAFRSINRGLGTATVTAFIGDVSTTVNVEFEYVPIQGFLSLAFRAGAAGDVQTVFGTSLPPDMPFRVLLVGKAFDSDGVPLAGVLVQFRIVDDDSTGSGDGPARLEGQDRSFTDASGEAFEQLAIIGVGRVVLEADLLDPFNLDVVATSNQAFAVTTEADTTQNILLTLDDGSSLTFSGSAPFSQGILATVTDVTGAPVVGATVRFRIVSDTSGGATLLNPGTALTDTMGRAINVVNVFSQGTVIVVADILNGSMIANTSNQVLLIGSAAGALTVSLADSTGASTATVGTMGGGCAVGIVATVADNQGARQGGVMVRFNIRSATAGGSLASLLSSLTDANGQAANAVTFNSGTSGTVVVYADVLDSSGGTLVSSNDFIAFADNQVACTSQGSGGGGS